MKRSPLIALTVTAGIVAAAGCSTTSSDRAHDRVTAGADRHHLKHVRARADDRRATLRGSSVAAPLPDVVGQHLSQTTEVGALACLDNIRGVAPDGHDPINNPARPGDVGYRITAVSPLPGARVGRHDVVTVQLAVADTKAPPAFRPATG